MQIGIKIDKQLPIAIYDTRNVGIRWLNVLLKYEKLIKRDYLRTIETWNNKPRFESEIKFKGARPRLSVFTNSSIYEELDSGTDIRYDVMTVGFEPKTKRGQIRSFPGEGGFAYKDTKNPRPGIEARRFSITITRIHEKNLQKELQQATIKGLKARKKI